jgi:hypothetical protein
LTSEHSIAIPARFDLKPHSVRLMPAVFAQRAVREAGDADGRAAVKIKNPDARLRCALWNEVCFISDDAFDRSGVEADIFLGTLSC